MLAIITEGLPELASNMVLEGINKGIAKGYSGWNTSQCTEEDLELLLEDATSRGKWVQVATYATMLHAKKLMVSGS